MIYKDIVDVLTKEINRALEDKSVFAPEESRDSDYHLTGHEESRYAIIKREMPYYTSCPAHEVDTGGLGVLLARKARRVREGSLR